MESPWKNRLEWNATADLQDVSIWILNVTVNDSGTYRCDVFRQFEFPFFTPSVNKTKVIQLKVNPKGEASVYFGLGFLCGLAFSWSVSEVPPKGLIVR